VIADTPEARITSRIRNSGDAKHADSVVQKGTGPTRTFTNVHESGNHQSPPNVRDKSIRETRKG
jgi:hypothetical protein